MAHREAVTATGGDTARALSKVIRIAREEKPNAAVINYRHRRLRCHERARDITNFWILKFALRESNDTTLESSPRVVLPIFANGVIGRNPRSRIFVFSSPLYGLDMRDLMSSNCKKYFSHR